MWSIIDTPDCYNKAFGVHLYWLGLVHEHSHHVIHSQKSIKTAMSSHVVLNILTLFSCEFCGHGRGVLRGRRCSWRFELDQRYLPQMLCDT
jgi:hypothetical protein